MTINTPQKFEPKIINFTPEHQGEIAHTLSFTKKDHTFLFGLEMFSRVKGLKASEARKIQETQGGVENLEGEYKKEIATTIGAIKRNLKHLESRISDYGSVA